VSRADFDDFLSRSSGHGARGKSAEWLDEALAAFISVLD
jgi:hypothetical protein